MWFHLVPLFSCSSSNGHKWLCSGKGSAFLYVAPWLQPVVHPAIISNYFGQVGLLIVGAEAQMLINFFLIPRAL